MRSFVFKSQLSFLSNWSLHRQVLWLAIPMVLSNITIPLLGLVDAAVIGHLEHAWYLGGVALGSTMISVAFYTQVTSRCSVLSDLFTNEERNWLSGKTPI
jgi:MATE family multidrug resistance protein